MFNWVLERNLGERLGCDTPLLSYRKYHTDDLRWMFFLYPFHFYTGHCFCLDGLPLEVYRNIKAFSFVRDPVDKTVSAYNYIRQRRITAPTHPALHYSIEELISQEMARSDFHPFVLDCSQTGWITGLGEGSLDVVSQALEAGHFQCFPTSRFDEACVVLEKRFPELLPDCAYATAVNASKPMAISAETRELIGSLPWMDEDYKLLSIAESFLDDAIAETFSVPGSFESAMADFRERCAALRPRACPEEAPRNRLIAGARWRLRKAVSILSSSLYNGRNVK